MTASRDDRRDMDQLEVAADLQDELNRRGLQLVRDALHNNAHPDFDGMHCMDCGEEIAEGRRRLLPNCDHCTDCQERKEKRR